MNILVTGDKGFVGTETTRLLRQKGHAVFAYDLMSGADIRDRRQLRTRLLDYMEEDGVWGIDRVLHLAAIARFSDADADPKLAFETNVVGTQNVVSVCKELHIPLVYASTGSAYMPISLEPPITEDFPIKGNSVYGCTKALGELYVREHTPHIILRYAHLYGKEKRGHGLIGGFLDRIDRGMAPTLYGGAQSNDFCYIKDIAQANLLALEASWDKWNQAYNIGTGQELSAEEAGRAVCEAYGYYGEIEVKEGRTVDASRFVYDISKAEKMLGFKPQYTFAEGLADMLDKPKKDK